MKRDELGTAAAILVVALLIAAAVFAQADELSSSIYISAASNLLGLLSGIGLVVALGMGAQMRWTRSCKVPWCLRLGEHPVAGTCAKVCTVHHTRSDHTEIAKQHRRTGDDLPIGETIDS